MPRPGKGECHWPSTYVSTAGLARAPWEWGAQQHPERGSTGLKSPWASGVEFSDLQNPPAPPSQNVHLLPWVWVFRVWVQGHRRHLQGELRLEG